MYVYINLTPKYHSDTLHGMNLKKIRNKIGISQTEFAEKLDLSRPTIARYEGGTTEPPPSLPYHIMYVFKLSLNEVR